MTRGSIAGTARDPSGAVVPGATVTVTNVATNAVQTVVTDGEGFYRVPALEPGRYTVTTELSELPQGGAARRRRARGARDTARCATGTRRAVGETVQVTADAGTAGLNKTNPTIATSINARAIEELPLPGGRNINNLVLTVPNASSTTGQGTYAINGNRPRNNNYMVDGSDNNDISVTIATSQIVPESVAEFQVMQNPYSVEFGRNSGGQINVITKSGSNRFRGDFFDYYQSSGLNSRTNIEKANNLATPPKLIRHQLGGDLGGPVLRDKLFFFGLYQRDSQRPANRPSPTTIRIPTQAGYAALQNVPLRDGQSAASRQAVLRQIGYLQDVYGASPVFRNVNNQLVNGVPIETGQTNVSHSRPEHVSHLARPRRLSPVLNRHLHRALLAERSPRRQRDQQPGLRRPLRGLPGPGRHEPRRQQRAHVLVEQAERVPVLAGPAQPGFPRERSRQPERHHHRPLQHRRRHQLPAEPHYRRLPVLGHGDVERREAQREVRRRRPAQQRDQQCRVRLEGHRSRSTTCRPT